MPRTIPALGTITAADRREARRVIGELHRAPDAIAHDARLLLAGIIPLDASASEADYRLCLLASFHTDRPGVIAAVLESSGLRRAKWRDHETYLAATIGRALARRQELANRSCFGLHTTQDSLRALIGAGNLPLAGPFPDPGTLERVMDFERQG